MNSTETAPRSVKLVTALLLVGVFAAGTVTGAGVMRFFGPPPPHHGPPGPPPMFGPLPLEELGLSADQKQRVQGILERHRPELEAVVRDTFPKVRSINDEVAREVRDVLTPEQRTKLDRIKATRPPPPPPPPPPPGGPGGMMPPPPPPPPP